MKKIISLIIITGVLMSMFIIGNAADESAPVLQDIDYTEVIGRVNQPDTGFTTSSTAIWTSRINETTTPRNDSNFEFYYIDLGAFSADRGGQDVEISQAVLDYLDKSLTNLRINGGSCIIRATYSIDGYQKMEPQEFDLLLRHQTQLCSVFKNYGDIIASIECGMIGAFGEMWGGKYSDSNHKRMVLQGWLDQLPNSIPVNVRTVEEYTNFILGSEKYQEEYAEKTINGVEYPKKISPLNIAKYLYDDPYFGRIALYNDAMIQDGNDGGTFGAVNRETFREFLQSRSAFTCYGGEFSGADYYRVWYSQNTPLKAIPEFYQTHLTYYHGGNRAYVQTGHYKGSYIATKTYDTREAAQNQADHMEQMMEDYGSGETYSTEIIEQESDGEIKYVLKYITGGWESATFGDRMIEEIGKYTDLTADLSDYKGKTVAAYFEDHLGYRLVLRKSMISGKVSKGGLLSISGTIDNTGTANITRVKNVYIILTDGEHTYKVKTNTNPAKWVSASRNEYDYAIKLPSNIPAGEYKVYMQVAGEGADGTVYDKGCVRFANKGEYAYSTAQTSAYDYSNPTVNIIYDRNMRANYIGKFEVADGEAEFEDEEIRLVNVSFDDVKEDYWGYNSIKNICIRGIMSGMSETTFEPETPTTRAMLVKVLHNLEGQPSVSKMTIPFTDIPTGQWYTDAVIWAYNKEITAGVTETSFAPSATLTREQFAALIYRYAKYKGQDVSATADLSKFTDYGQISEYAVPAFAWANAKGFITGMTDTILNPKGNATRAQMASILNRYLKA